MGRCVHRFRGKCSSLARLRKLLARRPFSGQTEPIGNVVVQAGNGSGNRERRTGLHRLDCSFAFVVSVFGIDLVEVLTRASPLHASEACPARCSQISSIGCLAIIRLLTARFVPSCSFSTRALQSIKGRSTDLYVIILTPDWRIFIKNR